jgi:hypothetical protein
VHGGNDKGGVYCFTVMALFELRCIGVISFPA